MGIFTKKDNAKKDDKKADAIVKVAKKEEVKKEEVEKSEKAVVGKKAVNNAFRVLVRPLITEKASILGAENKYFFEVYKNVNKIEVARAVNDVYGINPISVNIINVNGKKVRSGKVSGKKSDWKKAIVTLPKGKTIKLYEGV